MKPAALREARRRLGLTQIELAKLFQITRQTVSRYENGTYRIPRVVEFAIQHLEDRAARR